MILTKDEVVKMARQVWPEVSAGAPMPDGLERFATLCRAPLVAEVERLDREADQLIQERDHAENWGTTLATAVSEHFRFPVGEYSNMNDPRRMVDREIELRAGVEVPELQELSSPHDERAVYGHSRDQLLAYGAAQRLAGQQRESCTWTEQDDKDMPGTYESSCGEMWSFIDGGVKENRVTYCHHCGGKVVLAASPQEQQP